MSLTLKNTKKTAYTAVGFFCLGLLSSFCGVNNCFCNSFRTFDKIYHMCLPTVLTPSTLFFTHRKKTALAGCLLRMLRLLCEGLILLGIRQIILIILFLKYSATGTSSDPRAIKLLPVYVYGVLNIRHFLSKTSYT
jgi:hypothetical protein